MFSWMDNLSEGEGNAGACVKEERVAEQTKAECWVWLIWGTLMIQLLSEKLMQG